MKKLLLVTIALVLSVSSMFALNGIADVTSTVNYFYNPATVYAYNQASKFILTTGFADYHSSTGENLFNRPSSYLKAEFISNKISFSIDTNLRLVNKTEVDNGKLYDLKRDTTFNFIVATGIKGFSFGAGIYGGSSMEKTGVSNVLYQSILGDFERVDHSEFIFARVGALYSINQLSFGLTADQVLTYDNEKNELTAGKALDYVSAGSYWSESKYAKRGRLKKWVFNAGIEALNIFNNADRSLAVGGEAVLQLTSEYSVSFVTDFVIPASNIKGTVQTIGVGTRLGMFDIGMSGSIPLKVLAGETDTVSFNLNMSIIK